MGVVEDLELAINGEQANAEVMQVPVSTLNILLDAWHAQNDSPAPEEPAVSEPAPEAAPVEEPPVEVETTDEPAPDESESAPESETSEETQSVPLFTGEEPAAEA